MVHFTCTRRSTYAGNTLHIISSSSIPPTKTFSTSTAEAKVSDLLPSVRWMITFDIKREFPGGWCAWHWRKTFGLQVSQNSSLAGNPTWLRQMRRSDFCQRDLMRRMGRAHCRAQTGRVVLKDVVIVVSWGSQQRQGCTIS